MAQWAGCHFFRFLLRAGSNHEKTADSIFAGRHPVDDPGAILCPRNADYGAVQLRRAYDEGIRAVAVVCLHGHLHPAHERQIGKLARFFHIGPGAFAFGY